MKNTLSSNLRILRLLKLAQKTKYLIKILIEINIRDLDFPIIYIKL